MNIKVYILTNGFAVIGKYNKELESLDDILKLQRVDFVDPKTGARMPQMIGVPLGYPINQKEQTLSLDKLDILFEVTDDIDPLKEIYKRDLDAIQNPGIIQPKSQLIH